MKPTLLLGCTLLAGTALHAQFSLLPFAGYEQSRTTLTTNNISVRDVNGFLKAGLRTAYNLKGGHSPFVNVTTNPAPVSFAFDNTGNLLNQYRTANLLLRLEAGYQYNSKPVRLAKRTASPKTATPMPIGTPKKTCGPANYRSSCGSKKRMASPPPVNTTLNMRLQPSLALAYLPSPAMAVAQKTDGFDYTPAWRTAVVPAVGFEFAKGTQRLFTLSVFYTQPLAQKEATVNTMLESKTIRTTLQPQTVNWGLTLGVPFSFAKPAATPKANAPKTNAVKKGCAGRYSRRYMQL